jgi:biotin carboxylase
MYALGDKIGSTIIAQSAGVPVIAWNGKDLRTDYAKDGLPESLYAQADVKTAEDAQRLADDVGYPLMIKASEGGGGKGIRKVVDSSALVASFRQVQAEVPGSPIFLMKLAPRARHLEVQLLADMYGQAIALFGRDCSVQRRHQKIVEEGPVLAAPRDTWTKMERAAVTLAKAVGYVNAGTVEYLWMEDDGSFAFLELNPRLQVEHPVTEMVTNVNLPAAQLQVAMGIPLNCIPEIRRLYGRSNLYVDSANGETVSIDFDNEARVEPQGHVIAARITAENPDVGFQPTAGEVSELNFRSTPDVWGYFSVDSSGRVHEYADSQIGHLFAWGGTREDARQHMVLALKELSIRGDIRTTTEYLVHMMESDDFRANRINTAWLDGRILDKVRVNKPDALLVAMIGAVWRAHVAHVTRRTDFIGCLERGQFPPLSLLSVKDDIELIYDSVKYTLHTTQSGPNTVTLMVNGTWLQADFRPLSDGGLLVSLGGRSHVVYAKEESSGLRLVLDGATCMFTNEYDPTQLRAAMSGKLSRFLVEDGTDLKAGQPYAEVEVMKMYMSLCIPESGRLFRVKPEGSVLESGDLIAKVELEDPSKVRKAAPFVGTLPQLNDDSLLSEEETSSGSEEALSISPSNSTSSSNSGGEGGGGNRYSRRWHILARNALKTLGFVLAGYVMPRDVYDRAWFDRDAAFAAPELALLEVEECMAALASRLPGKLVQSIQTTLAAHKVALKEFKDSHSSSATQASAIAAAAAAVEANPSAALRVFTNSSTTSLQLDVRVIEKAIAEFLASPALCPAPASVAATAQPLRDICERFRDGVTGAGRTSLLSLLNEYMAVERLFCQGRRMEDVVADLRAAAGTNASALASIFETGRSHSQLKQRSVLVLSALARVAEEVEVNKNADKNADKIASSSNNGLKDSSNGTAAVSFGDVNSVSGGNLPRGSFLSVSSRSLGDETSERGDAGEPHPSPLDDDEDADTLDITQPMQLGGKSSTGKGSTSLVNASSLPSSDLRAFKPLLHQLAELRGIEYSEVTLEARQILVVQQMPSQKQRRAVVEELLRAMGDASTSSSVQSLRDDSMLALIEDDQPLLDDLMSYFSHSDSLLQRNAAEVYVRRLYRLYSIRSLNVAETSSSPGGFLLINWTFKGGDGAGGSDSRLRAPTPGDLASELAQAAASGALTSSNGGSGVLPPLRKGGLSYFTESYVDLSSLTSSNAPSSPTVSSLSNSGNEYNRISSTNDLSSSVYSSPPLKKPGVATTAVTSAAATAVALYQSSLRRGMVAAFPTFESFKENFSALLEDLRKQQLSASSSNNGGGGAAATVAAADELNAAALSPEAESRLSQAALNVMHVSILRSPASDSSFHQSQKRARVESSGVAGVSDALAEDEDLEKAVVDIITSALEPFKIQMLGAGLRRITFNVPNTRDSVVSRMRSSPTPLIDTAAAFVAEVTQAISPRQETQALRKLRSMGNLNATSAVSVSSSGSSSTSTSGTTSKKSAGGSINSAASTRQAGSLSGTFAHGLPWIYTFRSALGYKEDNIVRHIEPPASANLELKRLSNFRVRLVPTPNKVVHVYAAHARGSDAGGAAAGGGHKEPAVYPRPCDEPDGCLGSKGLDTAEEA